MMHRRRSWGLITLVILAASVVGVGVWTGLPAEQPSRPTAPWASRAETWVQALSDATTVQGLVPFYDPDVVLDTRILVDQEAYGVGGMLQVLGQPAHVAAVNDLALVSPPYISTDGAVLQSAPPFSDWVVDHTWTLDLGRTGIARQSFEWARASASSMTEHQMDRWLRSDLPARYVRAWASGGPRAVSALYTGDARLSDSIAGLSLTGRSQIAAAVAGAQGGPALPWLLRGARVLALPEHRGEAVFVNGWMPETRSFDRMVLLLAADLAPRCRGHVAVVADLAGGRVASERRYYRIDDARSCLVTSALPRGWWATVHVPDARDDRPGLVAVRGRAETYVWNGDRHAQRLLLWSYRRFAAAGLPAPAPPWALVDKGARGACLATPHRAGDEFLTLCSTRDKAAALHQLAHRWLDLQSPEVGCPPVVQSPAAARRCASPGPDVSAERAADVIAWGLMDDTWSSARLSGSTCPALAQEFHRLTGTRPVRPGCGRDVAR